jgi:hypothetical protein
MLMGVAMVWQEVHRGRVARFEEALRFVGVSVQERRRVCDSFRLSGADAIRWKYCLFTLSFLFFYFRF